MSGARPSDQALVSDGAATHLHPSGFDPSRVVTLRQVIRDVPRNFSGSYSRDRHRQAWRGDCTIGQIIDRLDALDTETATPADVAEIIGNTSWTALDCDNCGRATDLAVSLGQEPDYESRTALVCLDCVRAAAIAMEAAAAGETAGLDPKGDSADIAQPPSSAPHPTDGSKHS